MLLAMVMQQNRKGKGGRTSLGPRRPIMLRLPEDMAERLEGQRAAGGWASMNDYLTCLVETALAAIDQLPARDKQEELPLSA